MARAVSEKARLGHEAGSLLLEFTLKALLVAGLCELVLYRLISRLGMHLSKVAREYVVVEYFLRGASSLGFVLLNFSAILVFLGLFIFLFYKMREPWIKSLDRVIVMLVTVLVALTVTYLVFPPVMLGSVAYSALTALIVWAIALQYGRLHSSLKARAMIICYGLGVSGWLYYQTATTLYGWLGLPVTPPLVHEINRLGEALLVVATALVFAVYGGFSMRTKNLRQRRRTLWYVGTWASLFIGLLVVDSVLELIDPAAARSLRQSSQGIGWIFQMGMGYTFYLPFAFYVAGLLFWAYAVIKQLTMGRRAGYGLALMFIAGYALQLSHLTLFVVLGLLLITYDGRLETRNGRGRPFAVPLDHAAAEPSGVS
jgi:hypothetical protein